ncbi:MAG: roadblock/LC7 domain-containing protein [Fibrobacteraceae bacterium]|nr:roadblock/LC7 domain-containing protein [Fibrobacteraceae bacterium]
MSDFAVYTEDADRVRRLMQAYLASVKADYVMLVHRDGSIIAEVGSIGMDATPLAVLSTASFGSAKQIGVMLGEGEFRSVSYTGEKRSIYIAPVEDSLLLVQIFSGNKLPNRIEDYNKLLVEKLVEAVPAFTQNTSKLHH